MRAKRLNRALPAPLAAALLALLVGCGSDSSGETSTPLATPPPTVTSPITTTTTPSTTATSGKKKGQATTTTTTAGGSGDDFELFALAFKQPADEARGNAILQGTIEP